MKAIRYEKYGSMAELTLREVARPTPQADEVLVRVRAAGANPLDWRGVRAEPFLVRLGGGLLKPKDSRLGSDFAGEVVAAGRDVTRFRPGDAVFGECGAGAFAEYVAVKEKHLALKPATLSFAEAAAVPVAGLTALQALRDSGQVRAGQRVLINGGSGGIGTFMVQLAKYFEAEVTAVCSTRNVELVQKLGADHVVDYTREDFTRLGRRFDLVLDNVGNCTVAGYRRLLAAGGTGVMVGFKTVGRMLGIVLAGRLLPLLGGPKLGPMLARPTAEDLAFLGELLDEGVLRPVIDRCNPLAETAAALAYLEQGRARGKVVISMEESA